MARRAKGDGTLRKRKDGRWEGWFNIGKDDNGKIKRKSVTAKTKSECQEKLKKAQEEYEYLTGEENERRIAFLMDKAIRDEKSAYVGGKQDGIKEGIKLGRKNGEKIGEQKKQKEIAKKMKEEKVDIELIIKVTGLNKKQIEDL